MKHVWQASGCGYDPSSYCIHCGANNYESFGTTTCEEYREQLRIRQEQKAGTHTETNEAYDKIRAALTRKEWDLLKLTNRLGIEYRVKDRIIV